MNVTTPDMSQAGDDTRDHGGGLDAAIAIYGGTRSDWLDLSTGINPRPFPIPPLAADAWTALPDTGAQAALEHAARRFWRVPDDADIVAANGASALIAAIPGLWPVGRVTIPAPTYNEHAAAFANHGWRQSGDADTAVVVNPNNPDGRIWSATDLPARRMIIDESFCDVTPGASLIRLAGRTDTILLKSFGKFWGLAGLRLGFAITTPQIAARLRAQLGPWAVSGPALQIGRAALSDDAWADATRDRLEKDTAMLDDILGAAGLTPAGGTPLFRLVHARDAAAVQDRLCRAHILTRRFPYSTTLLRFGVPADDGARARLRTALKQP